MRSSFKHNTIHALVNQQSGTASLSLPMREEMSDIAAEAGCVLRLKFCTPRALRERLKHLLEEDPGAVMVGGGDGTFNLAANLMAGSQVALALLPLGTFNHFAKDAGVPLDPVEAFKAALEGSIADIDLGQVNDRYFLNNSSIGLYPEAVNERRNIRQRLKVPKFIAMLAASFYSFSRYTILHLKNIDGHGTKHIHTPMLFVGNNDYQFTGPGTIGRKCLTGGYLSVFHADPVTRAQFLGLSLKILLSSKMRNEQLSATRTNRFRVDSSKRRLRVSADGEVFKLAPPIEYRCRPGALRILIPRSDA